MEAGKLDRLAEKAISEHDAVKSKELCDVLRLPGYGCQETLPESAQTLTYKSFELLKANPSHP